MMTLYLFRQRTHARVVIAQALCEPKEHGAAQFDEILGEELRQHADRVTTNLRVVDG